MIERKNIEHTLDGHDLRYDTYSQMESELRISAHAWIKNDNRSESQRRNEDAIRRKLYGDVVDELLRIRQEIRSGALDPRVLAVERIGLLIDKPEWKDGLES